MLFSIFILATVVAVIWRAESLNQRNEERLDSLDEVFHGIATVQGLAFKQIDELKAFVDKHVKNGGIEEYKRLTQESIDRQLQEAAIKPMRPDTTYELVVSTIEAPKKKVANKRRKKRNE